MLLIFLCSNNNKKSCLMSFFPLFTVCIIIYMHQQENSANASPVMKGSHPIGGGNGALVTFNSMLPSSFFSISIACMECGCFGSCCFTQIRL